MGQTLETCFYLWLALAALGQGLTAFRPLGQAATELQAAWVQEYGLRRCGSLNAVQANLRASAWYLAAAHPELSARIETARSELAAQLGAESVCAADGPWSLHTSLHQQKHPGQPRFWPNWVLRLVYSPDRSGGSS